MNPLDKWLHNDPKQFATAPLSEKSLLEDPLDLFQAWFQVALEYDPETANIMHLATVNSQHRPNCRVVLLKSVDQDGFVFFTNYQSIKANELNTQPFACLNFFWYEQKRQVRVEGNVEKISSADSDAYFATRPRESQLGAWASDQSVVIPSHAYLDQRFQALEKQYDQQTIPRPTHWGGYLLKPEYYEFWQGRERRLHDRFRYQLQPGGQWHIDRLSP